MRLRRPENLHLRPPLPPPPTGRPVAPGGFDSTRAGNSGTRPDKADFTGGLIGAPPRNTSLPALITPALLPWPSPGVTKNRLHPHPVPRPQRLAQRRRTRAPQTTPGLTRPRPAPVRLAPPAPLRRNRNTPHPPARRLRPSAQIHPPRAALLPPAITTASGRSTSRRPSRAARAAATRFAPNCANGKWEAASRPNSTRT